MVVRRKYEAGAGQIGKGVADTPTLSEESRMRRLDPGPQPPKAPVWTESGYSFPKAPQSSSTVPQMGHVDPRQAYLDLVGTQNQGFTDTSFYEPVGYTPGTGYEPLPSPPPYVNPANLPSIARPDRRDIADRQAVRLEERMLEATSNAAAARGITAALQQQADLLRQQRENAIARGLSATAAEYDARLEAIDRQIAQINGDAANNEATAAWLQQQFDRPFQLAAAAAEAIDTAGAAAAAEAAVANLTQAKLEADARVAAALEEIGFYGEAGAIGIEDAQQLMAEAAFYEESLGVLEAQGAYQQEMADFQKDLVIASVDQIEATFRKDEESRRFVAAAKLRDALSDAQYDRNKVEAAKVRALEATRDAIAREYGEGVNLPAEKDFVMMAVQAQWDLIAGDLPDEQLGAYMDLYEQVKGLGIDFTKSDQLSNALRQLFGHWEGSGENRMFVPGEIGVDWDMEDVGILRQLSAIVDGAYQEYRSIQDYQGRSTDADNRDPRNIAEADRYFKTGEITGPYGERAAIADNIYQDIRRRWSGLKIDPPSYFRPLETEEAAKAAGRAFNSDHHAGGAMDIYFTPGSQNTARYQEVEAYLQSLKAAGIITYIPLGANKAHDNHIHVSFNLPYGGQKDFTDVTAGFNATSYGNETLNEAVDASPGSYSSRGIS